MNTQQATCEQRIAEELAGRLDDLRKLWALQCAGNDEGDPDLGTLNEYGLAFDYVAPGTFKDQEEGYFRYQLSWGGPSDEFRFYTSWPEHNCYRIEYVFLDWFDGATRRLYGEDKDFIQTLFDDFVDMGSAEHVFNEAMKDYEPAYIDEEE